MSRATTIARRELSSYFFSPMAYVTMTLFLMAAAFLFWRDFEPGKPATLRTIFDWMVWLMVIVVPVISMGLLAQEWSSGTGETLMTAPVGEFEIVLGKFLGAMGFYAVLVAPTLLFVLLLRFYSHPDIFPIVSGYLGILLVGMLFLSIGLFCSSLTRSQVVAAVSSVAILFLITIVPWWASREAASMSSFWRTVMEQGVYTRYADFSKGIIDVTHLVFFAVSTGAFLFFTTKSLEWRRWK